MYIGGQKDLQALDRFTIEQFGLPGVVLMENAGNAVVQELMNDFPKRSTRFLVLAGAGNNGGDGFVIARRLIDFGYRAEVGLLVDPARLKGDANIHYEVYCRRQLPLFELSTMPDPDFRTKINEAGVVIDAMLGTGIYGRVREPFATVIKLLNKLEACVYSIDLPSGVEADTGKVEENAVIADKTITFAMPKKGFFLRNGPKYIGHWKVVDISVPPAIVDLLQLRLPKLITEKAVRDAIPTRLSQGHKGTFGHGIVIGGSNFYVGAPIYSAKSAFQSGIGLVTLAIPKSIYQIAAVQSPESLHFPLADEDGHIASDAFSATALEKYKAIAIGPGMSRFEGGETLLKNIFESASSQPIVIDADALYFLRNQMDVVKQYDGPIIVTPHPGEMATLLGTTVKEVEESRLETAQQFANQYGVYLLLKGHRSIIATPDEEVWINPLGNDALGKGGSGDVLTGVILSFLAQGAKPKDALLAATYIHAKAGQQQGIKYSNYGVTPDDVIEGIRYLLTQLGMDR